MSRWTLCISLVAVLGCGSGEEEGAGGRSSDANGRQDAGAENASAHDEPFQLSCDVHALFAADGLAGAGCTGAICHGVGGKSPDFGSPGLAPRLLDQPAAEDGVCAGQLLIDGEHPERSLLLTKLGNAPPCGSPMPLTNRSALTEADRDCIEEYVRLVAAGELAD
jgi:hypothetical protein